MQTIDTSEENFKTSPLGFLMSVMAKYQAYNQKHYENSNNKTSLKIAQDVGDVLDNLKIELSKIESLKKEHSNEAILVHVIENCVKEEQTIILESVFEYLNLLDTSLQALDTNSPDGQTLIDEYYNVSRLGLILNCYLGEFENDDFFYGTLAEMAETVKNNPDLTDLCSQIISKVEKADINLKFREFIKQIYDSVDDSSKNQIYEKIIQPYADSLLEKVLSQQVTEEELNRLACAKQLQRIYAKLF